jgi:predicted secreted protein
MEGPMAPSEWIARRTLWGAPEYGAVVDETLRERRRDHLGPTPASSGASPAICRLFGTRVVNDGTGMIQLDVPHIVTREADCPVSVQVNWGLILANAVARLHLIADGNRDPLLTSIALIPDMVPPHVCINVRLDDSTDVHAVVECGDGTLLEVRRWVWVMPPDPDATDHGRSTH